MAATCHTAGRSRPPSSSRGAVSELLQNATQVSSLMMIQTLRRTTAAFLATLALAGATRLCAQDVILSEIYANGADRWIELHNLGQASVDLSTWSLYSSSQTQSQSLPQNYWWPFPAGTSLGADAFLRVHWNVAAPGPATPGELYTGTSPYGFLFGLGGGPLSAARGALALLGSQENAQMNSAAVVRDWVSWGEHGFPRESLAVQVGLWTPNLHCPAIPAGQSLARNAATVGLMSSRDLEWFVDPTPTPLQSNVTGAAVTSYGQTCLMPGHHLLGTPLLRARSLPLIGNLQFGYSIDNTTGVYGESLLFAFSTGAAPVSLPSLLPIMPGTVCREAIDTRFVVATMFLRTHVMRTDIPLSLGSLSPAMAGLELHAQAMVFDWLPNAWPPFQGLTNALAVVLGQ